MTRPTEQTEPTILVDFDATLFEWGGLLDEDKRPLPGAREALVAFEQLGYRIIIFTSRLSPWWMTRANTHAAEQLLYVSNMLEKHDMPFDHITAEKLPADFMIDDKAVRFSNNWREVVDFIARGNREPYRPAWEPPPNGLS